MAYNPPKKYESGTYPVHVKDPTGLLTRIEPLLTPKLLKSRFLKGILERLPPGVTYSNEELKDFITLAVNEVESELGVLMFAEKKVHTAPFDINLYNSWIFTKTESGPILELYDLSIAAANLADIYTIPAEWIDASQFTRSIITVVPLLAASGLSVISTSSPAAIPFLRQLSVNWLPSYWRIEYLSGICKDPGKVPVIVNQLIGTIVAINMLSQIQTNNIYNSQSISADGISQSSSSAGNQIYLPRINELKEKRKEYVGQLRKITQQKFFLSNI